MSNISDDFLELLHDFESLPDTLKSESIFDIAGYPHYENVCSNILAFYLNPNNEHGLGNLLFSSLMSLAKGNESHQDNFQINREVSTNKGGRLDIVIETDNQIIGIENKIFHHLNNDLADYSDSINAWAKPNQMDKVKIILSIRKEKESCSFVCVTYEEYWSKIKERLGDYASTLSQKWLLYLVDFMSSIEKLNGKNMELDKNDKFFIENEDRVNELLNARNKFVSKVNNKVRELLEIIEKPDECEKQWIYAKSCLVHDFNLSTHSIAFDLCVSAKGWELKLFGRNNVSKSYLLDLFTIIPLSGKKVKIKDSRHILEQYSLNTNLDEVKNGFNEWVRLLMQSEANKNANK
ncbi:MAG: PD-(D/E)XK nuclease family protein [Alteromonadaceae bacterium]|nr:PD-(D/E)XK nuclease family protein [Alteromonadaceae bacterium]